ncbi:terminase [Cupriavidus sp. 2TAF22]|uniref:terminase n=1 Tax=unclassified Cupriavidus TaxID=2640874 RepID=UPI003F8F7764
MARPSSFKPEFAEQARKLTLLGATNDELADFFGVSTATLRKWSADYPEFLLAIKMGKSLADANVAERLYQRACGFEHDDLDIRVVGGKIRKTKIRKYYPPDTAAAFIWLKNRQPAKWRDKTDPKDGDDVPPPVSVTVNVHDASKPEPNA